MSWPAGSLIAPGGRGRRTTTPAAGALADGDEALADQAVALFNRGTLGAAVTPDGTLWMSLFRACGGWPSGVWIDGDRQTAPDGSSFQWQHWSHTFRYALASTRAGGGWREAGFNAAAEEYNHDLAAELTGPTAEAGGTSPADPTGPLSIEGAPNVTLSALKPFGNPLAAGRPGAPSADADGGRLVTVRLRETDGRSALARLRMAGGIEAAWRTDLLEELAESDGPQLAAPDGVVSVLLAPFETVTVAVRPSAAASRGQPRRRGAAPPGPRRRRRSPRNRSTPATGCTGRAPPRPGTCRSRCTSRRPGSRSTAIRRRGGRR